MAKANKKQVADPGGTSARAYRGTRVGNGKTLLAPYKGLTANSWEARRYKELFRAFLEHIEEPSEIQKTYARRAAALAVELELMEGRSFRAGEAFDAKAYPGLCRLLKAVLALLDGAAPDNCDVLREFLPTA